MIARFRRLPIRWRLAAASAGLTFVILVAFALGVGRLASERLNDDFNDELRSAAVQIAFELEVYGAGSDPEVRPNPGAVMAAEAAAVRIVDSQGNVLRSIGTAPDLGPPRPEIWNVGTLRVAAAPVQTSDLGVPPDAFFVEYARDTTGLQRTIDKLWFFLGTGVLAGTLLAAFAGVAVAGRAMGPIAALTIAAREVASTRDPSRRMPEPEGDDEVAELAATLAEMLRELDAARSETQQMIAVQREFVADASHELRTPLTSVLANLELLQASLSRGRPRDSAEVEEMLASALGSSRRMSRLVSDLLLLARADAGRTTPRLECDFAEIAAAAVAESAPLAGDREVRLDAPSEVPVLANPDELHRTVSNLVDNALRHTPEGTVVTVRVERRDGEAELEVSDNGPGLPPGLEDHIFERFARGSGPADRSRDSGTGLGLAIVRAVATSHGGTVEAGRSDAGGARFTVRLPLAARAAPVSAGARPG